METQSPQLKSLIKSYIVVRKPKELPLEDYKRMRKILNKKVGRKPDISFKYEGNKLIVFGTKTIVSENKLICKGLELWCTETPFVYGAKLSTYSIESLVL